MEFPLLGQIAVASGYVPVVVGFWRFRKLSRAMKVIAVLVALACIEFVFEEIATRWLGYNAFVSDYYEFVEFCMLWAVFSMSVSKRISRFILFPLGLAYIIVFLARLPSVHNTAAISTEISVISRVCLVAMSLVALYSTVEETTTRVVDIPVFWVLLAVVLYSAGTLMVFGLGNEILRLGARYFDTARRVNWSLNIVANLFYTKAFLCKETPHKRSHLLSISVPAEKS
jgi:hypothetical protein